ncbi:hypothetical protein YH65_02460 [Sulfurovum lithotrophicum]|uniref:DUF3108 domain-containing protein n=1 Tax=Sulfurovum lithotrophicum TaxID=206403 RepID=A0A7U4RQ58_9BACT|nr:DUF3108 domain-containing protein [Sulfurovum lithotrophicum]AKF24382.1 hypothetical protein YH65_02460 [Sulfurovum lithotrophicum]
MNKTVQYILVMIFLVSVGHAKVLDAAYSVSYGIFGQLGVSTAHLETSKNSYVIEISARTTGIVKKLSRNRQEKYISKGHIVNGILISDSLRMIRSYGDKYSEKIYRTDHRKKKVTKTYIARKKGKIYKNETKELAFYSQDDLLTLYFNLPKKIDLSKAGTYEIGAVGAEKQDGKVTIIVPDMDRRSIYEKILGKGNFRYLTAIVYQKIFESNKGELMIAVGKDNIAQKAVLKDLVLYGDLVVERIK